MNNIAASKLKNKNKKLAKISKRYKEMGMTQKGRHICTHIATAGAGIWCVVDGCAGTAGGVVVGWAYTNKWLN